MISLDGAGPIASDLTAQIRQERDEIGRLPVDTRDRAECTPARQKQGALGGDDVRAR